MDILLSLSTSIISLVVSQILFSPSSEMPQLSEPSPTTAMTFSVPFFLSRAAAIPSAAEIAVPACPAPKQS